VNGKKPVINKKGKHLIVKYNDRLMQALLLGNSANIHGAKTLNCIAT
jgi:hypothetical protein